MRARWSMTTVLKLLVHTYPGGWSPYSRTRIRVSIGATHVWVSGWIWDNQKAHLSPRIKQSPSSSLHHQVTSVPRRLTTVLKSVDVVTETGQVVLHPAGPVTAVAAVDEVGALQKNSSSSHNWCFLYTTAKRYLLYIPDYKMLLKISRIPQI